MIYLDLRDGLCNRMRTIASLYQYIKDKNIKHHVRVYWFMNKYLNCPFEKIFEPIEGFEVKNIRYFIETTKYRVASPCIIIKRIAGGGYNKVIRSVDEIDFSCKYIYIRSCDQLYNADFSIFKPVANIDLIEKKSAIGIHIRRTDNLISKDESPINLFVEKMEYEISKDKNILFYVATDDDMVRKMLLNKFRKNIILQKEIEFSRNNYHGMMCALTDLINLSNCKKIYGSYWSSFSEVAAAIGNIELVQLRKLKGE